MILKKIAIPFVVGLSILVIIKVSNFQNPIPFLTNEFYISYYQGSKEQIKNPDIFIVNIKNFPLDVVKGQIEILSYHDPKVIAVDNFQWDSTELIRDSLIHFTNLVLPIVFNGTAINYSINNFTEDSAQYGFVNLDGSVKFRPFKEINGNVYPFFATKIIELYDIDLYEKLSKRNIDSEIINYNGNTFQFEYLDDLLQSSPSDLEVIKDKIVLVGYTGQHLPVSTDDVDVHTTPRSLMYGTVLLANILNTMMGNYIDQPKIYSSIFVNLLLCLFNSVFAYKIITSTKSSYLIIKIAQLLQIGVAFITALFTINNFQNAIDFEQIFYAILIAPELCYWYLMNFEIK